MLGDLLNLNRLGVLLVEKFRGDLDCIWRDGFVELLGKRIHAPGDSDNASFMVAKGDLAGQKAGKFASPMGTSQTWFWISRPDSITLRSSC